MATASANCEEHSNEIVVEGNSELEEQQWPGTSAPWKEVQRCDMGTSANAEGSGEAVSRVGNVNLA